MGYPPTTIHLQGWKAFCQAVGASESLSLGYHPQPHGQAEQANQDLGAALCCLSTRNPSSWSTHLAWIEYSHNSLPSVATGMSPFESAMGYQPPLFPAQDSWIVTCIVSGTGMCGSLEGGAGRAGRAAGAAWPGGALEPPGRDGMRQPPAVFQIWVI